MKVTAVFLPVLVTVSAQAVVETFQSFKSDMETTVATALGGMTTNMVMTGKVAVSSPLRRVRTDFEKIVMKVEMGSGGAGGGTPGLPGLPGLPSGGSGGAGGMEINIAANGVELLRYDLGKNFSWITPPGGATVCTCEPLVGEMPPYYVDAKATMTAGKEDVTINAAVVSTDKWVSDLSVSTSGMTTGLTMTYNVEAPKSLRQIHIAAGVSTGSEPSATDVDMQITMQFWNVLEMDMTDVEWSKPDPSCKCPVAPVIEIAEIYPAVCTAPRGCACNSVDAAEPDIEFCKDIVTWPIAEVLFPKSTDKFVKKVHESFAAMPLLTPTAECAASYKVFLCKFYFQVCSDGGKLLAPPAFDASCNVASVETNGYTERDNIANGRPADAAPGGTPDPASASAFTTAAASPLLAVAVAAFLL